MKIEKTVLALFIVALVVRVSSVYYSYRNFDTEEKSRYTARHTHRVIESIYQLEFQAATLENASDKYIMARQPYYAIMARQSALTLNSGIENLLDSVKGDPAQTQQVTELNTLVVNMERNLPGVDSMNHDLYDLEHPLELADRTQTAENSINLIISKADEIIDEQTRLLKIERNDTHTAEQNTIRYTYYAGGIGLFFVFVVLFFLNRSILRRRKTETKIRENEERLRLMLEEVGDVIFSCDYMGRFIYINSRLESLTGYTIDELLGKHFTHIVRPDYVGRLKEFYGQQFKNRIYETRYEFPIVTKQGAVKWVEDNVVLVSRGKVVESFQCVVRDITQRKNIEEEITRTNRFLDSVLEHIPNMIFIKDANDLRFLRFNKSGEELLGYLQEDMLGKNDYDFFPEEQADFFTEKDKMVLAGHKGLDIPEEPISTKTGPRWLHTRKIPVYDIDGKPLYLLGISEDITERKKNEDTIIELNKNLARYVAELEESQRFYKTLAHNFPDGTITVLDHNMNYVFVDGLELALEGLRAEDLLGQPYLQRFPRELREEIKNNIFTIYNGTKVAFEISLSGNHYVIHGVPLTTSGGITNEILLVKQNITKLKEAEENMRMALEKEKLINELKSRFVTLASHEFRTPLSTILSSTELIGEYIEHEGPNANAAVIKDKNLKHLKRIKTSIQNLVNILNSFLSLEQLEQGKAIMHPVEFDVKEFATEVIEEIQGKLKNKQKIKYTHHSSVTKVYMDRLMLKNVVLNLLANAIKYSPEETGIRFNTTTTKEGLEFSIEDRGIGIPENEQSNLFERFFRAKNTLNIEGTGLGLSIVKKYIDLLNGQISFTSRENEGSTFTVSVVNAVPVKENNLIKQENP